MAQSNDPVTKVTNQKEACGVRKVCISGLPMAALSGAALALSHEGGGKYGLYNYREAGVSASTYIDAVWRHLFLQFWEAGEDIDSESGLCHVDKAIASLIVLRDGMIQGNWEDDRPIRSRIDVSALNADAARIIDARTKPVVEAYTQKRKDAPPAPVAVEPPKPGRRRYNNERQLDQILPKEQTLKYAKEQFDRKAQDAKEQLDREFDRPGLVFAKYPEFP